MVCIEVGADEGDAHASDGVNQGCVVRAPALAVDGVQHTLLFLRTRTREHRRRLSAQRAGQRARTNWGG